MEEVGYLSLKSFQSKGLEQSLAYDEAKVVTLLAGMTC